MFYGWVIVGASFVNQIFNAGLGFQGFGTFIVPLENEFGWSKTQLSAARSFMQVENGLMGPVEGVLVDRFGPRRVMAIGMFIFGCGLLLVGVIDTLWMYYLAFIVVALGTSVGGFLVMSTAINNWFRRKRTLAMSLAQTGLGVGGILLIPLLIWAQGEFGWRIAAISAGLLVWIVGVPASILMRHTPEQYGVLPDGDPMPTQEEMELAAAKPDTPVLGGGEIDFTLKEALNTPAFWLISIGHGLSVMVISTIAVHQFAHMEQGVLISRSSAALVVTVLSVMNILGRISGGFLGDKFDKRLVSALGMAGASIAVYIFAISDSLTDTMVFGIIYGFSWGIRGPMMNSLRGEYFGRSSFGKIIGAASLITTPAAILGPIFAGFMADTMGNYTLGFIVIAVISGLGSISFIMTRRPQAPYRVEGTSGTAVMTP